MLWIVRKIAERLKYCITQLCFCTRANKPCGTAEQPGDSFDRCEVKARRVHSQTANGPFMKFLGGDALHCHSQFGRLIRRDRSCALEYATASPRKRAPRARVGVVSRY